MLFFFFSRHSIRPCGAAVNVKHRYILALFSISLSPYSEFPYLLPGFSFFFSFSWFPPQTLFISPRIAGIEVIIIHHGTRRRNHVERSTLYAGDFFPGHPFPKGRHSAGQARHVACRSRSGTKRTQVYSTFLSLPFQITKPVKRKRRQKMTPAAEKLPVSFRSWIYGGADVHMGSSSLVCLSK